jgi:lipopolysaccharide export system protein LptA
MNGLLRAAVVLMALVPFVTIAEPVKPSAIVKPPEKPPIGVDKNIKPQKPPSGNALLGNGNGPIEITADQALEWRRDAKAYVARGNAKANQGGVSVSADLLIAYYQEDAEKKNNIYRIDARGNVRLVSADATARGDNAVYDLEKAVAVIKGNNLQLSTATDVITARDSLEYWRDRNLAVARGNAVATREKNRLQSDILTARFAPDSTGNLAMKTIEAKGAVTIQTPTELVRGDSGEYDLSSDQAVLKGNVKITRGKSQLNGDQAEVDMVSGNSRIIAGPKGKNRVRGLFSPADKKTDKKQ